MPLTARIVPIGRDPHSDEVRARGGDAEAESILQRSGFFPAVALLGAVGYAAQHDPDFAPDVHALHELTIGAQVADLAKRIRVAEHSEAATAAISELVAPDDGILPAVTEVLRCTADLLQGLGDEADPAHADRVRHLADQLSVITTEVGAYRDLLADRHTPTLSARHAPESIPWKLKPPSPAPVPQHLHHCRPSPDAPDDPLPLKRSTHSWPSTSAKTAPPQGGGSSAKTTPRPESASNADAAGGARPASPTALTTTATG
ncbi:hypothetical protein [Streptomyces yangpuensis]|uniref:hypothetical protein n=1 Tax=Streptomyces yangpuensis TaxID=1648182 RepID=UPI00382C4BA9